MNVKHLLDEMNRRAFDDSFIQAIHALYADKHLGEVEPDYRTGYARLQEILSEEQKAILDQIEIVYEEQRKFAARYGFQCGIYGAFRQYFDCSNSQDGGFNELVNEDMMMQPKMQRHHENYTNVELCNNLDLKIMNALYENDQEHMVSITCALQQRVYSAAMDGFYCGYRAAYEIMDVIHPLAKTRCIDKILTMEFHLGLIKPYSEVERLRDMAA